MEQVVLAIVVTTGIASIFLTKDFTPDYNSGLAHAIFYAMTSYPVIEERHLHGEVVGFGVLLALLVDQQPDEFEKIYQLNKAVGLPTSPGRNRDHQAAVDRMLQPNPGHVGCSPLSLTG